MLTCKRKSVLAHADEQCTLLQTLESCPVLRKLPTALLQMAIDCISGPCQRCDKQAFNVHACKAGPSRAFYCSDHLLECDKCGAGVCLSCARGCTHRRSPGYGSCECGEAPRCADCTRYCVGCQRRVCNERADKYDLCPGCSSLLSRPDAAEHMFNLFLGAYREAKYTGDIAKMKRIAQISVSLAKQKH